MYRIAVCDDMPEEGKILCGLVQDYFEREDLEYTLKLFSNAKDVIADFDSGVRHDVYILDILMPGTDGMELARTIRGVDESCTIVFVTVSANYLKDGYKVQAMDYIIKPVIKDELWDVLSRVVNRAQQIGTIAVKIKDKYDEYMELRTVDIVYVECRKHTLFITMRDGSVVQSSDSLDDCTDNLTKYDFFLRCHKGFIVNLHYVKEMNPKVFLLSNGSLVDIAQRRYLWCKGKYRQFLLKKVKGVI